MFDAVLFDCDGVLVDSESITIGVLRDMLEERGWSMSTRECMRRFVGKTVRDERVDIEARTGMPFTDEWLHSFFERRNQALSAELVIIEGALDAAKAAHAHCQGRIACASGADRFKVEMQLTKVGLMPFFEGRIFSGHEMPRSKPAPDVYLAAASALAMVPERCLVIEDTSSGVSAGVAAGATVWAYCPPGADAAILRQAGASRLFEHMGQLPALLSAA